MKDSIQLIVGLGNPGSQYEQTRHNAGAEFVEQLAARQLTSLQTDKKFFGRYGKAQLGNQTVHLLIPTTFMNLSGQSVAAVANFYKIPPESILVAHDELDLPPGIARFKQGGGHGGHNGLRDIISRLGNNKNFYRLRIGIGHPGQAKDVAGFVLTKAPVSERSKSQAAIDESLFHLPEAISGNWAQAMNKLHSFKG
ncbi:aminoacyl-tRNA hydrolase [Neptunomonas phycophila]|jgi:PTH1 family peptidyl-tRNA hydrolase|uniref:Peptidyl-tRNA hydrolase n=1 Tax=Neptunomonas phycophila TaxID=1572645 RepID=A0AAW7XM93_9GAMM|nr:MULTISPECIES: aminoacyl-tRNA hydrolase [Neptunomonas]MBT3144800.1 aminoacyl-tRNA hydrolase [Neptunomonas phycophila]MDN2658291.1 aminoacyl-tRNA hydrolase [Neptunomonas sp. CHC150]MDO6454117.1 aminoacyl-tRNA hydrolase [Neptunomonas phycophila]MDO6468644.1 aminoacyl-tRNA hydrolase [Neptunomonas phycophila]MDO6785534.1 aminoacyl-tRNA hydrolase [Neptunomonas phycophila]